MHFWEQFILMSETYVRGSVIKDFTCWSERTLWVFLKNIEIESFKLWFTRWTGFLKLTKKWKIYAKWFIYIFMHMICILYRDFAIMGMCLNKVLVRRILMTVKTGRILIKLKTVYQNSVRIRLSSYMYWELG